MRRSPTFLFAAALFTANLLLAGTLRADDYFNPQPSAGMGSGYRPFSNSPYSGGFYSPYQEEQPLGQAEGELEPPVPPPPAEVDGGMEYGGGNVLGCDIPAGCDAAGCDGSCGGASEPDQVLGPCNCFDRWYDHLQAKKECLNKGCWKMPVGIGAWHWFHESLIDSNDGYGIDGLRGTYWWFVTADPEYDLGCGRKVGGHLEYRLRDGDPFRSFFDSNFWSYEAYGYIQAGDDKLKAGQIWKRFGLDWDGVFFGNAPYFDGFKLDPDYGVSLESSYDAGSGVKVDRYLQFFFHEDSVNGSFGGADAESVAGYTERNTAVARIVPTYTYCDGSTVALGLSGLVGEIQDTGSGLGHENVGAVAVDLTYTKDKWKVFGEVFQSWGVINPVRYTSGGPSNKLTGGLAGIHYTTGPYVWRVSYSAGMDANPYAMQNMVVAGTTIKLSKGVDLYFEYVNEQVDNSPAGHTVFFNSLEAIIYWHY